MGEEVTAKSMNQGLTSAQLGRLSEILGDYVYLLVDPRNGCPFYIGKGKGARALQHGVDAQKLVELDGGPKRLTQIRDIYDAGKRPQILIARRNLRPGQYSVVEASLIDAFRTFPIRPQRGTRKPGSNAGLLTNKVRGAGTADGLEDLEVLVKEFAAEPLNSDLPLLIVRLNPWKAQPEALPDGGWREGRGWKAEWVYGLRRSDRVELADSVRCWFNFGKEKLERRGVQHVVASYRGVTRAVFEIEDLAKSYVIESRYRKGFAVKPLIRGGVVDEVVGKWVQLENGAKNPLLYWPRDC